MLLRRLISSPAKVVTRSIAIQTEPVLLTAMPTMEENSVDVLVQGLEPPIPPIVSQLRTQQLGREDPPLTYEI